MYILVSKTIFDFIKNLKNRKEEIISYSLLILLIFILIIKTASAYPSYTSYFNEFAGGSKNGYHYVTDSNADWGQDLKRLKIFLDNHSEIEKIRVDYFGMADLKYYLGNDFIPWWRDKRPLEPGWYAISALFLQESIYDARKPDNQSYRWLKNRKPDYQVGTSILVYHISEMEAMQANSQK